MSDRRVGKHLSAGMWIRFGAAVLLGVVLLLPARAVVGQPAVPGGPKATHLVLIVVDGFRPDYLSLAPMHHLHALMSAGTSYSNAWVGQLEAQTPTGHATIATGVFPRKHGVIGFVWRDPTGQNITWMPTYENLLNAGDMERLIEAGGVPSISDLIHRQSPGARIASVSCEKIYAADAMGVGADYIVWCKTVGTHGWILPAAVGTHVPPASTNYRSLKIHGTPYPITQDIFATRMALQLIKTVHPRALLLNLPGTDIEGHRDGGVVDTSDMRDTVRAVDADIGKIMAAYKAAGLYNQTLFVVTADHGMVPNRTVVPKKSMYNAVRATGKLWLEEDYLGSAGYVFLRNAADASAVATALVGKHFKGVEGALYKTGDGGTPHFVAGPRTSAALGPDVTRAYEDLSDTLAAPNGPEVVLPYTEDSLGVSPTGLGTQWGTHGGLSWGVQHIPLVLSGPGVRRGVSSFPAQLVDVAPTIERLMGLTVPSGVDGVVLSDALRSPDGGDAAGLKAVEARRTEDVIALRKHSLAQHGITLSNQ